MGRDRQPPERRRAGMIAERLRRYREERGWTQRQLATTADVSATTVSAIERGHERPLEKTARALARALGISTERLLGLEGQPTLFPHPDERRLSLIRRIVDLDDDQVERAWPALDEALEMVRRVRKARRKS